jgi:hypothetical protein
MSKIARASLSPLAAELDDRSALPASGTPRCEGEELETGFDVKLMA